MTQFRIAEAADLVGVSYDTVRRRLDDGDLPARPGESNSRVIDGVDLAAYMAEHRPAPKDPSKVTSSARNRLVGLVISVVEGPVMSQVEMQCGRHRIVSLMSTEAVRELGLEPGALAVARIKSTDVTVEIPHERARPSGF